MEEKLTPWLLAAASWSPSSSSSSFFPLFCIPSPANALIESGLDFFALYKDFGVGPLKLNRETHMNDNPDPHED